VTVFDASALLAFVQGELGADVVEDSLVAGGSCSVANWSEVAQKVLARGRDWELVKVLLESYELELEPVTVVDAEWAAKRWRSGESLSLGDRLCLALSDRLGGDVLTADAAWGAKGNIRQIR
jgi:ribonuclease VapC